MRIALQPTDAKPNVPSFSYLVSQGRPEPEVELGIYAVKELNTEIYRAEFSSKGFLVRPGTRGKSLLLCSTCHNVYHLALCYGKSADRLA